MDTNNSRNLTGLYLSGFIQEGYLPPQERKSTIPSTLYRGHVVKLARRPNSNPHRNSVGKYPMHSLNSGFNGALLPTKDLKNFRSPEKHQSSKVHGKWTNYPMSVELRKIAGVATPGRLLADYILHKSQHSDESRDQEELDNLGRFSSSASFYQDKEEEMFYRSMYDEIEKIVTKQSNFMATNSDRLQKILLNNSTNTMLPNVTRLASASEQKRARTSHGYFGAKPSDVRREGRSKRPYTTAPLLKDSGQSSLLLPLPYVSRYDLLSRQSGQPGNASASSKQFNVSPSPFKSKLEGLLLQHKGTPRVDNMSRQYYPMNMKANIGTTSAERLRCFLNPSNQQSVPSPNNPSSARETVATQA